MKTRIVDDMYILNPSVSNKTDFKDKDTRNLDHVLFQFAFKGSHSNEKVLKKSEIVSEQNSKRRREDVQVRKVSPFFQTSGGKQDMLSGKGHSNEKVLKKEKNVSKQNGKIRRVDVQIRKVSPYFQISGEKQDIISGNSKTKPKVVKVSPYFLKNNDEILDGMKKPRKPA